jgi:hypothetical protein
MRLGRLSAALELTLAPALRVLVFNDMAADPNAMGRSDFEASADDRLFVARATLLCEGDRDFNRPV